MSQDEKVRVLLTALECHKGDPDANLSSHRQLLDVAASTGCDFVLFPEMSLTGSVNPATEPTRLMTLDDPMITALVVASRETGVGCSFGIAERASTGVTHITQLVVADGRCLGLQRKRHLGDGEESFTPGQRHEIFHFRGNSFGVAICAEAGFDSPFDACANANARLVLFPAAPGLYGRRSDDASWRTGFSWWEECSLNDAKRHARRHRLWIGLSSQAGSTVDEDFPGLAALINPRGEVVARLPDWREGTLVVDIPLTPSDDSLNPIRT